MQNITWFSFVYSQGGGEKMLIYYTQLQKKVYTLSFSG